jgi:hypothetical protein
LSCSWLSPAEKVVLLRSIVDRGEPVKNCLALLALDSSLLAFIQFLDNVLDVSNVFCDVADISLYSTEDGSGTQMIKKW